MLPAQDMTPVTGVRVEDMGHKMGLNGDCHVFCLQPWALVSSCQHGTNALCVLQAWTTRSCPSTVRAHKQPTAYWLLPVWLPANALHL